MRHENHLEFKASLQVHNCLKTKKIYKYIEKVLFKTIHFTSEESVREDKSKGLYIEI